ncbi:unnamed protein product [Closterium sp. NIES-54]
MISRIPAQARDSGTNYGNSEYQKPGYHQRGDFATPSFAIPRQRDVPTLAPAPSLEKQIHRRQMRSTAANNTGAAAADAAAAGAAACAPGAAPRYNSRMALGRSHGGAAAFQSTADAAIRAHSNISGSDYHTHKDCAPALLTINGRRRPSLSVNPTAAPPAASVSSSRPGGRLTRRGSADVVLLCGSKGGGLTGGDIQGMAAHKDLSKILISSIDIVSVPGSLLPSTASPPPASSSCATTTATASATSAATAATTAATSPAAAEFVLWGVQFTDSPAWIFRSPNGSLPVVPQSPAMGNTTGMDKTRRGASRRSPLSPHSPPLQFPHSHPPPHSPPLHFSHSHSPPPHSPPLHSPNSLPASPHKLASTSAAWQRPTSRLSPTEGGGVRPLVPRSSSIPELNTAAAAAATDAPSAALSAARAAAVAATCAAAGSASPTLSADDFAVNAVPSGCVLAAVSASTSAMIASSGALLRRPAQIITPHQPSTAGFHPSAAGVHQSAASIQPILVDILPVGNKQTPDILPGRPIFELTQEMPDRPSHCRCSSLSDIPSSASSSAFSSPFTSLSPSSAASPSPSSVISPRFSRFEPSLKLSPGHSPADTSPTDGAICKSGIISKEASGVPSGVLTAAAGSGAGTGGASSFGVWVGGSTRPTFADALAASRLRTSVPPAHPRYSVVSLTSPSLHPVAVSLSRMESPLAPVL